MSICLRFVALIWFRFADFAQVVEEGVSPLPKTLASMASRCPCPSAAAVRPPSLQACSVLTTLQTTNSTATSSCTGAPSTRNNSSPPLLLCTAQQSRSSSAGRLRSLRHHCGRTVTMARRKGRWMRKMVAREPVEQQQSFPFSDPLQPTPKTHRSQPYSVRRSEFE